MAGPALALAALLLLAATVAAQDCSAVTRCPLVQNNTGCGWCWQSMSTARYGEKTQGRPGNANGPTDGGTCHDWTFNASDCQHHVDCPFLPNCQNILGTYCGWCEDTQAAARGSPSGPSQGTCKTWIWNSRECPTSEAPQHVHLAFGEQPDSMVVTWASLSARPATLYYGTAGSNISVPAVSTNFSFPLNLEGLHNIHRAAMTNLKPATTYWYMVRVGDLTSARFETTTPQAGSDWPLRLLVFGDMGRFGGGDVLYMLTRELAAINYTALVHVGDFAYDLRDNGGLNGDAFMARIQQLATKVPYMTSVGNHEIEADLFQNYRNRFSMPRYNTRDGWDMWYSWDIQHVHMLAYSSEVFFANINDIPKQLAWLEADLKAANANRANVPWIIAYGHRPMYCSNDDGDDCTKNASVVRLALEALFHKYGVDLVLEAHEHSYERLWPVYNYTISQFNYIDPQAMVHIISGAAGCNEDDGACINNIPGPRGPWSAFRASVQGTYSYLRMTIFNATHLYLESYSVEQQIVEDSMLIVQHNHGMRV